MQKTKISQFYAEPLTAAHIKLTIRKYGEYPNQYSLMVPIQDAVGWKYLNQWNRSKNSPFSALYKGSAKNRQLHCKQITEAVLNYANNIANNARVLHWDPFNPYNINLNKAPIYRGIDSPVGMYLVKGKQISAFNTDPLANPNKPGYIKVKITHVSGRSDINPGTVIARGEWINRVQRLRASNREIFLPQNTSHCQNWSPQEIYYSYMPQLTTVAGKQIKAWKEHEGVTPSGVSSQCTNRKVNYKSCQILACNKYQLIKPERYIVANLSDAKLLASAAQEQQTPAKKRNPANSHISQHTLSKTISQLTDLCNQQVSNIDKVEAVLERRCQANQCNRLKLDLVDVSTQFSECILLTLDASLILVESGGVNQQKLREAEQKISKAQDIVKEAKQSLKDRIYPHSHLWK